MIKTYNYKTMCTVMMVGGGDKCDVKPLASVKQESKYVAAVRLALAKQHFRFKVMVLQLSQVHLPFAQYVYHTSRNIYSQDHISKYILEN